MRKFGLVGYPLEHSFSKGFFEMKFAKEGLSDYTYDNLEIKTLKEIPLGFDGLNVTIPHKESVMKLLKSIDPVASEIGAVNCIDKNLRGYNTDVVGFEKALLQLIGQNRPSAIILGSGGAAKAAAFVLRKLGIEFLHLSRSGELKYSGLSSVVIARRKLIINATPVGMFPNINEAPPIPYDAIDHEHYLFDMIYNPAETKFLREGRIRGAWVKNGFEMLKLQAEAAWEIWNKEL